MKLDFSNLNKENPFEFESIKYVVKTGTAGNIAKYNNARSNATTFGTSGEIASVSNSGDLKLLLVSLCCYVVETNKLVSLEIVKDWPEPMINTLFDEAKRVSNIDQPATVKFIDDKIALLQEIRAELVAQEDKEKQLKNS